MKILELKIENVRGIKSTIDLSPNGENMVIHGPNGSGKSAVVDAIEFLFTGEIRRLTGRGTKGISLKEHGPHIDTKPQDAVVKAKIQVEGMTEPIELQRKISKPRELKIKPATSAQTAKDTLAIAERGQHVLSRGEILKFIAVEAHERAEEILAILNLDNVEELRKNLGTLKRESDRTAGQDKTSYETSIASINTAIGIEEFSEELALKKVNEFRKTLKGEKLESLDPTTLKGGISPPSHEQRTTINPEALQRTLEAVGKLIVEKGSEIEGKEKQLRQTVQSLKEDEKLKRELESKRLIDLGISLIDETGACPLCLTEWKPGELETMLRKRLEKAERAEEIDTKIQDLATEIDTEVTKLESHLATIEKDCEKLAEQVIKADVVAWRQKLKEWSDRLEQATEDYPTEAELPDGIKTFLTPAGWTEHEKKLRKRASETPTFSAEQNAWDTLTTLKPLLERYQKDKKKYEQSQELARIIKVLNKTYTETRDEVLENLYDLVNDDFAQHYRFLHGEDERTFSSELKPEGPQLDLKVDFYGRGTYHPRALHSEGHQDSMGLCLYLALNKKITEDKVKLVILDDVVMSIDTNHRRQVCKLLNEHFKDRQFVITTHNRTWARQLNTDGVVKKANMVEFKGWTVDTGPRYKDNGDVWNQIKKKLDDNEVASAAHQLREHCEFFYEGVCDSMKGQVCYRSDERWELGDYLKGAKEALKTHLKQAKKAANSWNKKEDVERYNEIETQANEIIQRTQMEHWAINENVHYSKWADFSKEDLLPVVEAFQDLEDLFRCPESECQGILVVNMKGQRPTNVKCPCGATFWNLEEKEKQ